ncbi:F-box protein [Actinidia chinensis var. chinensis]|uniref:F-box protein n=1 Tax=Actinidia chinensis var. chinensis TaxID=1590841 RepID=A0A2R6QDD4_ACTCC|nr:F-box protein [Actinidia chinensis var. chinensis]
MPDHSQNIDMFSQLTNPIIIIIISFLPFKDAVKTSVLSKRWRHLWYGTTTIDLDQAFFVDPNEDSSIRSVQGNSFIEFSKRLIQYYSRPTIAKFRLAFSLSEPPQSNVTDLQEFIHFAISHKVKALDLDFSNPTWDEQSHTHHCPVGLYELPDWADDDDDLESLKLFSCNFRVSEFNKFGALKSLSLGWVKLPTSSFKSLLLSCVFLESLSLKKCWDLESVEIRSQRLMTLVIDKCSSLENGVVIDVPNLRVFKYCGPVVYFVTEYLNGIVEADLDFGIEVEFNEHGDVLHQLLMDVWCVRILSVCSYMLQVIPSSEEYPSMKPPLNGVKHMILKTALHAHEYHGISFFLSSCPNLETLTIDIDPARRIFHERGTHLNLCEHEFLSKYIMVYRCVERSLKVVEIKGFKGALNEVVVINYLLSYGPALETMSITVAKELGPGGQHMEESYRQQAHKILKFRRASKTLNIMIN